jgi:zinc protease
LPPRLYVGPGGLRIVVAENHSSPITSVAVYCLGGVRNERGDIQGISHLTQRMLLKGTRRRSAEQLADELEFLGARYSPFTSKDMVGATLSVLSRHLGRALGLLAECILEPAFVPEELEKERRIILTELRRRQDDSFTCAMDLSEALLYRKHPYRFSVGGTEASVRRLQADRLVRWHGRLYSPDRMVVAVVGDLRATHMRDLVLEAFAPLSRPGVALSEPPAEDPPGSPRCRSRRRDKKHVALALSFMGPAFPSSDFFAMDVLSHVLAGMGGRLFVELRDRRGLGYAVGAGLEPRRDGAHFSAHIGTSMEHRRAALEGILGELDRVRQDLVPREELSRVRRHMLGLFAIALQRKAVQAGRLAFFELMGAGYGLLEGYPQAVRNVTPEAMREAARRHLHLEGYACGQVLPRASRPG